MPQPYKLYKTVYTQEETWVTPIDQFIRINVNNKPAYIPMEQIYRLGPSTYLYAHVPIRKMEEKVLPHSTVYILYKLWVINETIARCNSLNETMNDNHVE